MGTQGVASLDRGIGPGLFPQARWAEYQHHESGIAVSLQMARSPRRYCCSPFSGDTWNHAVKANVFRTTRATASAFRTRSVRVFSFGTQRVSYRRRVSRQMSSGRRVPRHLPSGRGVSGHFSFRTQRVSYGRRVSRQFSSRLSVSRQMSGRRLRCLATHR